MKTGNAAARRVAIAAAVGTLLAIGACATGPDLGDEERLALYRANAGEPVRSFRYFGRLNGWTPLGDRALAVWTRPTQSYLLELAGPCPDLDFAQAISISNQFGSVHARFDSVSVLDRDPFDIPCRIERIRPVDTTALKQAQQDLRESVQTTERAAEEAAQPQPESADPAASDQDSGGT